MCTSSQRCGVPCQWSNNWWRAPTTLRTQSCGPWHKWYKCTSSASGKPLPPAPTGCNVKTPVASGTVAGVAAFWGRAEGRSWVGVEQGVGPAATFVVGSCAPCKAVWPGTEVLANVPFSCGCQNATWLPPFTRAAGQLRIGLFSCHEMKKRCEIASLQSRARI